MRQQLAAGRRRERVLGPLVALAIAATALFSSAGDVSAHALLKSATPAPGSTVGTAPSEIVLTFTESPDPRLSSIRLVDTSGANRATGAASGVPGKPLQLEVTLPTLPDGVYTVSWRTVSSVDGHAAAGSFAFGIGVAAPTAGPAADQSGASASGSPPTIVARWLLYAGLVLLFGVGFVALVVHPGASRRLVRLGGWAWLLTVLGTLDVVGFQWLEAQVDITTVLGTSIGVAGAIRLVVALAGLPMLLVAARGGRAERPGLIGLGVVAAAAMVVDVANGHAAAATAPIVSTMLQWFHVAAAGMWMGGLAAMLVTISGLPAEERYAPARRFSSWAAGGIAMVAATGIVRAITEIGSVDAILGTDYGRVLVAKTALLAILAVLGATNRFFGVPRVASAGARLLGWVGSSELVTSLVVLGLSALLVNLVPPVSAGGVAAATVQPVVAVGHDFGTSVRARLVVSPGTAGFSTFDLAVTDFDTAAPVPALSASLRFESASATNVAASNLDLAPSGGPGTGTFSGQGGNLSPDGIWRVTATVQGPKGNVEVPLVLATRVRALPSSVNAAPGVPPITTLTFPDGRSLQVYLDPGRSGTNDVHATFFDAAGAELPIQSAAMALGLPDGTGVLLSPRLLEPGHFVGNADVPAGSLGLDVVAPDPSGILLHAHATIEVTP